MLKDKILRHLWLVCALLSVVVHLVTVAALSEQAKSAAAKPQPVKIKIVDKKPEPKIAEVPKPPPPPKPPEPPKPKPKPQQKKPKVANDRPKPVDPNLPPPKPIQGLAADAMSKGGKVGVALGNTLMTGDTGERPKQEPAAFEGDLSADARLVADSIVKPEYTDSALEANLEGMIVVEVQVDEAGKVVEASLKRKVGYGMDERILNAVKGAHFSPRKDRFGKPEGGWTEIKFNLQLP